MCVCVCVTRVYTQYNKNTQTSTNYNNNPTHCLYTAPSAPPQNIRVTAITSESLKVTWDPPPADKQNGDIRGYRVYYSEVQSRKDFKEANKIDILDPNQRTQMIEQLRKYTAYNIWVSAFTDIGDGPTSDVVAEQTKEDGKIYNTISYPPDLWNAGINT